MNARPEAAPELAPAASDAALVYIDPDINLPAERGNGFLRAFRILFPKAA